MPRRPHRIQIIDTSHLRQKTGPWHVYKFNEPVYRELRAQAHRENVTVSILVQQCLRDVMQGYTLYCNLYRPWPVEEIQYSTCFCDFPVMLKRKFVRFCHKKGITVYIGLLNSIHGWLKFHGCSEFEFDEDDYSPEEMANITDKQAHKQYIANHKKQRKRRKSN